MTARKKTHRKTRSSVVRKRRQARKRTNALSFEALESRQLLAAITVSNASDILSPTADTSSIAALVANDGGDGISLREAVEAANNTVGEDAITFDAEAFLDGDANVIRLVQRALRIRDSLEIDGSSVGGVVITGDADGNDITLPGTAITDLSALSFYAPALYDNSAVLLNYSDNLTLTGLTITGGRSAYSYGQSAGINSTSGNVFLINSIVSGNSTESFDGRGGGIRTSNGNIYLDSSTVAGNRTAGYSRFGGGGISSTSGNVFLSNSTVSDNVSQSYGGGVRTFSGNVSLINSTVSGNRTGAYGSDGGGILTSSGNVSLINSTVTGNSATGVGGGIHGGDFDGRRLTLLNSIVAGNGDDGTAPDLLAVGDLIVEHSLISDTIGSGVTASTGPGNLLNQLPLLGPLADNGGPTQTHALLIGSPAANAGSNVLVNVAGLTSDQRGEDRIQFGTVDIGAFESDFEVTRLVVTTNQDVVDQTDDVTSLREAIAFANEGVSIVTISFDPSVFNVETTINLSSQLPTITDGVTITGPGANLLTIDAQGGGDNVLDGDGFRIFEVNDGDSNNPIDVSISGLTLTGGDSNDSGGAIKNFENLTLERVGIVGNRARLGGGFSNELSGVLTVSNSTIANNEASQDGGGISTRGAFTAVSITVSGNSAVGNGGAIVSAGDSSGAALSLTHSTLTNNTGNEGVYFNNGDGPTTATFNNTIIDSSVVGVGSIGTTLTGDNNLFAGADPGITGPGNLFNQISMLGLLADNGGSTLTHALLPGSPAIDAGSNALSLNENGNLLVTDQRGEGRIRFGTVDIGAVEFDTGASDFEEVRSLVVTLNQDIEDQSDGFISLREAIAFANDPTAGVNNDGDADGDGLLADTITFDARVFTGGDNSVIRLTQGELLISEGLSIDGSSVVGVVITGDAGGNDVRIPGTSITDVSTSSAVLSDNSRVLNFSGSGDLNLIGLTITGGQAAGFGNGYGGGIRTDSGNVSLTHSTVSGNSTSSYYSYGGGISTGSGNVTLTHSTLSGNSASGSSTAGGGIRSSSGSITLINSTVNENVTSGSGGGVYTSSGNVSLTHSTVSGNVSGGSGGGIGSRSGSVTLINSTVNENVASGSGGGVNTSGNVSLTHSTVSGNVSVGSGGGIGTDGNVSLTSSTVSGNTAGSEGGGVFVIARGSFSETEPSILSLVNSTLTGNSSETGGGISVGVPFSVGPVNLTITNSIVADNIDDGSAPDLNAPSEAVNSLVVERSLLGDTGGSGVASTTGVGNILNQSALLGPLADNGGSTLTHALLPGSPAIDAGSNALALDESGNPLTTDQRGEDRIQGGTVDIGAVEFGDSFLLGDANLDGFVNFLDISPFIALLSGGTFLDEADINRDGNVDFLDISPFISVLSFGGSAQSNLVASNLEAPSIASGSAVTSQSIVVGSPVSSVESLVSVSKPASIASTVEVPITTETSDAIDGDAATLASTVSEDVTATTALPQVSLVFVNDSLASPVNQASDLPVVGAIEAGVTLIDTFIGPVAFRPTPYSFLWAGDSSLRGAESNGSLVTRRSLVWDAQWFDLPREARDKHLVPNVSAEESFSTAAELFDAHPESLDEIFDFELEETLAGLI